MSATPPSPPRSPPTPMARRTPLGARGEPMVWLTGLALTLAIGMIVALLLIVITGGIGTFWPRPIDRVIPASGTAFLGVPVREETYDPGPDRKAALRDKLLAGEIAPTALNEHGDPVRRLYRVGNKEVLGQPFRWIDLAEVRSTERPDHAVLLERQEWGVWVGLPEAVVLIDEALEPSADAAAAPTEGTAATAFGERRTERKVINPTPDDSGRVRVRQTTFLAEGPRASWEMFQRLHPDAEARRECIERLKRVEMGRINAQLESERIRLRAVQLRLDEGSVTANQLAAATERFERRRRELDERYARIGAEIAEIEASDDRFRFIVRDPATDRFAPIAQTRPDEPIRLSQVVRAVPANLLDTGGKWGVYASRWWEYLSSHPREANTEGGVFPVIFGTVILTLLLSVMVVPLGVVAALYLREYARQGVLVSIVRIAVNNLAGVPSIVYGVFGLGFFCYTVGHYIDAGPSAPLPRPAWGLGVLGLVVLIGAAAVLHTISRPKPGRPEGVRHRILGWGAFGLWFGCAALFVFLLATTPYFQGFFRARLPTSTFGTKGILWSSLTLALLTLPVVIVATEEAISAVPRSLREASYGCGASKWQTIRRVVLPRAAPGIMTGMILAMARGAGEVAPLMLVGAVKLAPELPFEAEFPFLHPERSFMHLGFHIYDLGFQSPDSEAARPLVWTTTLLLISIVVILNLFAIILRARLRRRFVSGQF